MAFTDARVGVVMDVVYNHVPDRARSNLEACVPGYYFRPHDDSGAGSDIASERSMARAYIVDSCRHWLSEYKLSGFRFDLMGLYDLRTMEETAAALRRVKGDALLYGEGWDMYSGKAMEPASMRNAARLPGIGMFNDAFRCAIKGSIFLPGAGGWIHDGGRHESMKFGIVGAVAHPQVDNGSVIGTARPEPWTENAWQSVSYTEVHDNLTLADKLLLVEPDSDEDRREALARMASALVLLSQGMPLMQAGMEFMRSKELPEEELRSGRLDDATPLPGLSRAFSHNSYRASDKVNAIAWALKAKRARHCLYVEGLIALRRAHQAFRLGRGEEIRRRLSFVKDGPGILSFLIDMEGTADPWRSVLVAANAREREATMHVGADGPWFLASDGRTVDLGAQMPVPAGALCLEPKSVVVLCRKR
jgi:pullulanase